MVFLAYKPNFKDKQCKLLEQNAFVVLIIEYAFVCLGIIYDHVGFLPLSHTQVRRVKKESVLYSGI